MDAGPRHEEIGELAADDAADRGLLPLEELAATAELEVAAVTVLCQRRVIVPAGRGPDGGLFFDDRAVFRLRWVRHLDADLGVNEAGIDLILRLLEELEQRERALRQLRDRR